MMVPTVLCAISIVYTTIVYADRNLYENDVCDMNGSTAWTCQRAGNCPHFREDLDRGIRPRTCGFNGSQPIICCNIRPSEGWCSHYESKHCSNTVGILVTGGQKSRNKEFPYMALIGYGRQEEISWQCGGSVISDQFVLSAAHCVEPGGGQIGPARWVRLGDLDISTDTDDAKPEDFTIVERIVHPEYNEVTVQNDIAVFKLHRKVNFGDYIKPVCLHQTPTIEGDTATVTGWGRVEFVGPTSAHLMKAKVSLFSNKDCRKFIGNNLNSSSQLCAGELDGARDTCQGDSGGPLTVLQRECLPVQIGVTSYGKQCGLPEAPGVYTRVSHYLPWIESIVWP